MFAFNTSERRLKVSEGGYMMRRWLHDEACAFHTSERRLKVSSSSVEYL